MTDRKLHWNTVYATKDPLAVSWYQEEPVISLKMIANTHCGRDAAILDVGGGASVLVDRLLMLKFNRVSVLDISVRAIECTRQRLGDRADRVEWLVADITEFKPASRFDIWHDRAVLHFLTAEKDREKYVDVLRQALKPGGQVVIGTFAIGGPEKCSGLPVVQYDAGKLGKLLGPEFVLEEQLDEIHMTPAGAQQEFAFFRYRRNLK